ncbi:hypothetical protein CR513_30134, partial [Mucuna pruriens]
MWQGLIELICERRKTIEEEQQAEVVIWELNEKVDRQQTLSKEEHGKLMKKPRSGRTKRLSYPRRNTGTLRTQKQRSWRTRLKHSNCKIRISKGRSSPRPMPPSRPFIGEKKLMINTPLPMEYVEEDEEALKASFQALEIVGTSGAESKGGSLKPSKAAIMVAKVLIGHNYQPGKGLGKDSEGIVEPVRLQENPRRSGLSYTRATKE